MTPYKPPEPSLERWGGARTLIFSVPYSDVKILTIIDGGRMKGAIYNPYKLTKPMPWLDRCPHCREGRQKSLPLKIRKLVQVLCSVRPDGPDGYGFTLPNHYRIGTRKTPKGWGIRVRKPKSGSSLYVIKMDGAEPVGLQESAREFRSPILLRTLKLLFSAKETTEKEIQAILLPMHRQPLSELPNLLRTPCRRAMHP